MSSESAPEVERQKEILIKAFNGCCHKCGITDHRVLRVVSVKPDQPRFFYKDWSTVYAKALMYPDLFVLLCRNCEAIRKWVHYHQGKATSGHSGSI